jgi:hypothetical protein
MMNLVTESYPTSEPAARAPCGAAVRLRATAASVSVLEAKVFKLITSGHTYEFCDAMKRRAYHLTFSTGLAP